MHNTLDVVTPLLPENKPRYLMGVGTPADLVDPGPDGLVLRDVSARLAAPKSSLLPLLRALRTRGYLAQGLGGEYRLGPGA